MADAIQKKDTTLGDFLASRRSHLAEVLPKSSALTPERIIKLALLATKKNTALSRCDMGTVFNALLQCAELGLDPGGATGEAYLVPYGDVCQLIIGYKGFIALARRSGSLKQIETRIVHKNDKFDVAFGIEPKLEHRPLLTGDPGEPVLAYCIARLTDGASHVEVMTVPEIERIKNMSKAKGSGPWKDHWEEMARKTVLRRAAKYLTLSPEFQRAAEIEDESFGGDLVEGVLSERPASKVQQLEEQLTGGIESASKPQDKKEPGADG